MRKKRILFHSNSSKALTGFGKNLKNVLRELFKRDKYEIYELANGNPEISEKNSMNPWVTKGGTPSNPNIIKSVANNPNAQRLMGYGHYTIDNTIKEFKPDIYVGIEDPWAFTGFIDKPWWNKINCMVWTTLDSLPIYPEAVDIAPSVKNYYVWASFAAKELNRIGYNHVKTLHGTMDTSSFKKLDDFAVTMLRDIFSLKDCFVIGFVFRNQLRKSVPNILDGFKLFKQENPESNAKLFFHTCWREGWDINRLLDEKNIPRDDIITTYVCTKCGSYDVKPFTRENLSCRFCGGQNCQVTPDTRHGVDESQLNEIYNLMDVYCHPFTSGGQEMPIQEAKLAEKITLVTNYSCGEDCCGEESGGLPLDWHEYREPGTQFIKASTDPVSIKNQLQKVYKMNEQDRSAMGKKARQFVIDNYSTQKIVDELEKIFDEMPHIEEEVEHSDKKPDITYTPPDFLDDEGWLIDLYKNILNKNVDKNNSAIKNWLREIAGGVDRRYILEHIKKESAATSQELASIEDYLGDEGKENRVAVVIPESAQDVLFINSLLGNLKTLYKDKNIYVITDPKYYPLIDDNPAVYKVLPYIKAFDNIFVLEGQGENHEGYFQIAYLPHLGTQRLPTYPHNGSDKIQIELY
jgi:glycosyltransferase involved in cell wall biosynthesis